MARYFGLPIFFQMKFFPVIVVLLFYGGYVYAVEPMRWCAISEAELAKCEDIKMEMAKDPVFWSGRDQLSCILGIDKLDCMRLVNQNAADFVSLDAGLMNIAAEFFTMVPIMAERYQPATPATENQNPYYSIVLVKQNANINSLRDLAKKQACFPGAGRAAGWVLPMSQLINSKIMPVTECNVQVKSAASFFGLGNTCIPGALKEQFNPFGDNPVQVCALCKPLTQSDRGYCGDRGLYAGYTGAMTCLQEKGDVAFLRHDTLDYMASIDPIKFVPANYKLVCPPGAATPTASVNQYMSCNWGQLRGDVLMTSALRDPATIARYKRLFKDLSVRLANVNATSPDAFQGLFASPTKYSISAQAATRDLLFTDTTVELVDVALLLGTSSVSNGATSSYQYLGQDYMEKVRMMRACPTPPARWCVISAAELEKCERMMQGFAAKRLKPDLDCVLAVSTFECMRMIHDGDADLMNLDPGDLYVGGRDFGLVPIAAEDYGDNTNSYHVVAVARKDDKFTTLYNMKNKRTCHPSAGSAAGWYVPVANMLQSGMLTVDFCSVPQALSEIFWKSCVPGILEPQFNPRKDNPISLCEGCAAGGINKCVADARELYYGDSGAFRCLVEQAGDIAFVRHTTVRDNTDGRNTDIWSRNRRSHDYQLMCRDGRRRPIDQWQECNMARVPAFTVVTADFKTQEYRDKYWNLLNYAQFNFGSDRNAEFAMFESWTGHKDLIFTDACVRLSKIPPAKQNYTAWLGGQFLNIIRGVERYNCNWMVPSKSDSLRTVPVFVFGLTTIVAFLL